MKFMVGEAVSCDAFKELVLAPEGVGTINPENVVTKGAEPKQVSTGGRRKRPHGRRRRHGGNGEKETAKMSTTAVAGGVVEPLEQKKETGAVAGDVKKKSERDRQGASRPVEYAKVVAVSVPAPAPIRVETARERFDRQWREARQEMGLDVPVKKVVAVPAAAPRAEKRGEWMVPYPRLFNSKEFRRLQFVSPGAFGTEGMAAWNAVSFNAYFLMDPEKPAASRAEHVLFFRKSAGDAHADMFWKGEMIGTVQAGPHQLDEIKDKRFEMFRGLGFQHRRTTREQFDSAGYMTYTVAARRKLIERHELPATAGSLIAVGGAIMEYFTGAMRDPRVVLA